MTNAGYERKAERNVALDATSVEIKGRLYRLNDISTDGIGLIVDKDAPAFFLGQRIDAISMEKETKILKGVVAHISINENAHICGIRFLFGSSAEFEYVAAFKNKWTAH